MSWHAVAQALGSYLGSKRKLLIHARFVLKERTVF
jgi:hypothetical protein